VQSRATTQGRYNIAAIIPRAWARAQRITYRICKSRGGPSDGDYELRLQGNHKCMGNFVQYHMCYCRLQPAATHPPSSPVPRSLFPPPWLRACCPHPYASPQRNPRLINSQTAAGTSQLTSAPRPIEPRACCPDGPAKSANYLNLVYFGPKNSPGVTFHTHFHPRTRETTYPLPPTPVNANTHDAQRANSTPGMPSAGRSPTARRPQSRDLVNARRQ